MGTLYHRKFRKDGKSYTSDKWYLAYFDADGRRRYEAGYTDKEATRQLLAKREREAARQEVGLHDPYKEHRRTLLTKHVEEYRDYLRAKGSGRKHRGAVKSRLDRAFQAMGISVISGLSAERAERYLLQLVETGGVSKKTRNQYLTDLRAFARWGVRSGRWPVNPLEYVKPLKGEDDVRRRRRALTQAELRDLLEAAERRPVEKYKADHPKAAAKRLAELAEKGQERALLYRVMAFTGLRLNEARTLSWGALSLSSEPPTITIEAKYAKSKRRDTVPLHPSVARLLKERRAKLATARGMMPAADERVFRVGLHPERYFLKDLTAAGIKAKDRSGAVVDMHSLRHTTATWLTQAGVSPRMAQAEMRHADLKTTMGVYTHLAMGDKADAVGALPDLERQPEAARAVVGGKPLRDSGQSDGGLRQHMRQQTVVISGQEGASEGNGGNRSEAESGDVSAWQEAEIDNWGEDEATSGSRRELVGVTGLEPAASTSRT